MFRPLLISLCLTSTALATTWTASSQAGSEWSEISGIVELNQSPLANAQVTLFKSGLIRRGGATEIATAQTNATGEFSMVYKSPPLQDGVLYLIADGAHPTHRLATILDDTHPIEFVTINELSTVGTAYVMNQFLDGDTIGGNSVGVKNSASTFLNLIAPELGQAGSVISNAPNGLHTEALSTFNTLGNILAVAGSNSNNFTQVSKLATPNCGSVPQTLLGIAATLARNPALSQSALIKLSQNNVIFTPALPGWDVKFPITWTIMLLYGGDDLYSLDGPGHIAVDKEGSIWIGNNFEYAPDATTPVCDGKLLIRLKPNGQIYPGSPYTGGGVSGVGFGIAIDPENNVWVGNFGFVGDGATCSPAPARNSLSKFSFTGEVLSPESGENPLYCTPDQGGFCNGEILAPQGMASAMDGTLWTTNLCSGTLTQYPNGDPYQAINVDLKTQNPDAGPFGAAVDGNSNVWVTDNGADTVYRVRPTGVLSEVTTSLQFGLKNPLGNAIDSYGNVWVANSEIIPISTSNNCDDTEPLQFAGDDSMYGDLIPSPLASIIRITPDGRADNRYVGGGLSVPWGITVDGDDHIWVADFNGKRIAKFCGANQDTWPCGLTVGDPISPSYGYRSIALERSVSLAIDQSGNVWLSNNFKQNCFGAHGANPGGLTMVQCIGVAAPVAAPSIGPPQRPNEAPPVYCSGDFNGDGFVNVADLLRMIESWGESDWYDLTDDGNADVTDLLIVVGNWGPCE
jgi:sugar lactone lactonase YvrE